MTISLLPRHAEPVDHPDDLAAIKEFEQWLQKCEIEMTPAYDADEPVDTPDEPTADEMESVIPTIVIPKPVVVATWTPGRDLASDYLFTLYQLDDYVYGIGSPDNLIGGLIPEQSIS